MAAKISFPNRACPKCGKAIHIKSKNHECGWKAEGSTPSPKTKPAKTEAVNGTPANKMDAVRRILAESGNDTMPVEIQNQLKAKFKIKMDPGVISNYKSTILKQGARKKMGRPKGSKTVRPAMAHVNGSMSLSIEDIQAVKDLVEKMGVDKLLKLTEVLTK